MFGVVQKMNISLWGKVKQFNYCRQIFCDFNFSGLTLFALRY